MYYGNWQGDQRITGISLGHTLLGLGQSQTDLEAGFPEMCCQWLNCFFGRGAYEGLLAWRTWREYRYTLGTHRWYVETKDWLLTLRRDCQNNLLIRQMLCLLLQGDHFIASGSNITEEGVVCQRQGTYSVLEVWFTWAFQNRGLTEKGHTLKCNVVGLLHICVVRFGSELWRVSRGLMAPVESSEKEPVHPAVG